MAASTSDALEFVPAPGSNVELKGTSTIGAWMSRSTDIRGRIVLYTDEARLDGLFDLIEAAGAGNGGGADAPPLTLPVRSAPIAEISVPVTSLHGDSIGMDHDMQKALNAEQHPVIEYVLQNLQQAAIQRDPRNGAAELKLSTIGELHMAGAARPFAMDVIVKRDSRRHFLAHAQTKMLMSDFGVSPPVALFGLIKGGEQVLVVFDLDLVLTRDLSATQPTVPTGDARRR